MNSRIERNASGMAQKVWQKITMLDAAVHAVPTSPAPGKAAPADAAQST